MDLSHYPHLERYYGAHQDQLRQRNVARRSHAWWRTIDSFNQTLLTHDLLVMQDMKLHTHPIRVPAGYYPHHGLTWFSSNRWNLDALGGLLTSEPVEKQDHERILTAIDFWVKTKLEQQQYSQASGHTQGGTRAAVTGGKHMVGINQLILDELQEVGLTGVTHYTDRKATMPGYYRESKSWDLLVLRDEEPVLAIEYKSMTDSEGKNLNNRANKVIGSAQDLRRAQDAGFLSATMKRRYVFLMEVTSAVQVPVEVTTQVGHPDPAFEQASYLQRMALMCQRLRDDGLYHTAWALG